MASAQSTSQTTHASLAAEALRQVYAASAAEGVLVSIAAGTAHPDALADGLIALLAALPEQSRAAAIHGYLRNAQKRIEAIQELRGPVRSKSPCDSGAGD
jgi:glycine/D-amino acid oxidase-like deaminating enzyme